MRAFRAAVLMICALGKTLAASDADQLAIRGIIQDQIEAFRRDDAARAFSYATPALQNMFGSQERFMSMVKEVYNPVYRPRSYTIGEFKDMLDGTSLSVQTQDLEGMDWLAVYTLEQQPDGTWRISGCYLAKAPGQAV